MFGWHYRDVLNLYFPDFIKLLREAQLIQAGNDAVAYQIKGGRQVYIDSIRHLNTRLSKEDQDELDDIEAELCQEVAAEKE